MRENVGRWTSHVDGDFVVLLVGARVDRGLRSRRARTALRQLQRVLAEIEKDPGNGLLGYQHHGGRHGLVVQYWRSQQALERFTRDPANRHAQVWRAWFDAVDGDHPGAGFWRESFQVRAGEYAAAYSDMPELGLLRAGVPAPLPDRPHRAADG